jgi:enoyl-CoA hydratase/carnithine racemase
MSFVLLSRDAGVLRITINRPEQRNAVNDEVLAALRAALDDAAADTSVRAVVLTGAGDKAFCAGADLRQALDSGGGVFTGADTHPFIEVFRAAERLGKPLIARINGHAMAGGLGLVCMCDLAIAVDSARFGTPEARVGVFPLMILSYLMRLVPRRRLMEMCLTADAFDATAALEYGLLNQVVPAASLDSAVDALVARLTANSPTALMLGKKAFRAMEDMTLTQCFEYAQLMIARASQTPDAQEGMSAFLEKREPRWPGA